MDARSVLSCLCLVAALAFGEFSFSNPLVNENKQSQNSNAGQEANNNKAELAINKRIADYNEALVFFTAVLGLVGIVQGFFIYRQAKIAGDAIVLGSKEFNSTHRPLLVLRELEFLWPSATNPAATKFIISNKGGGSAHVVDGEFFLKRMNGNILEPRFFTASSKAPIKGMIFAPGQRQAFTEVSNVNFAEVTNALNAVFWENDATRAKDQTMRIIFEGFVSYIDGNGLKRHSSFYREYDFTKNRFRAGDDPEREYAD